MDAFLNLFIISAGTARPISKPTIITIGINEVPHNNNIISQIFFPYTINNIIHTIGTHIQAVITSKNSIPKIAGRNRMIIGRLIRTSKIIPIIFNIFVILVMSNSIAITIIL